MRRVAKFVLREGTRLDFESEGHRGLMACPEGPATSVPGSRLLSRAPAMDTPTRIENAAPIEWAQTRNHY